jgi:hypothetical protein
VVGCGTFPTWNTYPGLFAALATGNAVIVKPHSNAILPAAITVRTIRAVLAENGIDPNLVTLCVTRPARNHPGAGHHPAVKSVDFTGGNAFGQWLIDNCRQAQVYAELAGVNNIVIDSTDAYKPCCATWRSPCRCTPARCAPPRRRSSCRPAASTPKTATSPTTSVRRPGPRHRPLPVQAEVAHAVLGAIQSADTLARIEANSRQAGQGLLASKSSTTPNSPRPKCAPRCCWPATPAMKPPTWKSVSARSASSSRWPTRQAPSPCPSVVSTHGALTAGVYSTRPEVIDAMTAATWRSQGGAVDQPDRRRVS